MFTRAGVNPDGGNACETLYYASPRPSGALRPSFQIFCFAFNFLETRMKLLNPLLLAGLLAAALSAHADINVGVTLSATGPAASLGIPEKNTIALMPKTIGGQKINYIVLDDASDTTAAVTNTRKLLAENKVDIILGSTVTPASLAMIDVAAEALTPMISMAASARIIEPMDAKRKWVFKTPQNDIMMSLAIAEHMQKSGIKTVGFIGFSDAYGEGWSQEFAKAAGLKGLTVVANERFARSDTSVTGQTLKLMAAKPDAVLVAGSGTPAALPQKALKERGYTGKMYQTHGVANADFLRVGGKDVEGTFLPAGPVLVAEQLPASNPVRKSAQTYVAAYEAAYGKGTVSTFGAHAWDAGLLMTAAVPIALKKAQPGTPEFRAALRDALEQTKEMPGAHGIFTLSPTDHLGLDQRARVMVKIENGAWKYQP
ncbi:branched-chain amino acid transport system substrate-binding protein [Variovorax sp. GrIS 2.14]